MTARAGVPRPVSVRRPRHAPTPDALQGDLRKAGIALFRAACQGAPAEVRAGPDRLGERRYRLRPHSKAEPVIHALSAPKRHGQVHVSTTPDRIL